MSRREEILHAASRIISKRGVQRFTIEEVAREANVSKGGFLYHFPSKEKLIIEMNKQVIKTFNERIEHFRSKKYSYHEAYLLATVQSFHESEAELLNMSTSILAAISNDKKILQLWQTEYERLNELLRKETYKLEHSLLVKTVCDGLWFSKMFQFTAIDENELETLAHYLLQLFKEERS